MKVHLCINEIGVLLKLFNFELCVCVSVWVGTCACRCPQRPEALDSSVTASTRDCESIKMAARNEIWALCKSSECFNL